MGPDKEEWTILWEGGMWSYMEGNAYQPLAMVDCRKKAEKSESEVWPPLSSGWSFLRMKMGSFRWVESEKQRRPLLKIYPELSPTSAMNLGPPQHGGQGRAWAPFPSILVSHVAWKVTEVPVHLVERYQGCLLGSDRGGGLVRAGSSGGTSVSRKEGQVWQVIPPGSFCIGGECTMKSPATIFSIRHQQDA